LLFTILLLSRSLKVEGKEKEKLKPNYKTIVDKSLQYKFIPNGFVHKFVRDNNLSRKLPTFSLFSLFLSNKAGPHGKATLTATRSKFSFRELLQLSKLSKGPKGLKFLLDTFKFLASKENKDFENNVKHYSKGRISFIYDPECKLRLIAIVDYYTQLFLKPIHDIVLQILRTLPCDRTFTQDPRHT
jgi:hypothetical protein